jgi:DNA helicase-2/ATP-dependent DNA helicase PcrA
MTNLTHARRQARNQRAVLGGSSDGLLERLRELIERLHNLEIVPVNKEQFLGDSRAEIVRADGCLYYDRGLDRTPNELLEVLSHELGHLVLHHRSVSTAGGDLIRGSVFLENGAPALSRYSPRSREEAEASAFASEFVCPASEVFLKWQATESSPIDDLARQYGATNALIRIQLAEGLFRLIADEDVEQSSEVDEAIPTPEQELAAKTCGTPVLVDAGPGTGKTKTLIRRILYLLREKAVPPEELLILTFSNEAAAEIQKRIEHVLGEEIAARILAVTFHGYGVVLLNTLGHHVGLDVDFSILDEMGQQELVSDLLARVDCEALLNIKNPEATASEAVANINFLKDRLVGPEELKVAIENWNPLPEERTTFKRAEALWRLFEQYELAKRERHQVDFADLILLPYRLLASAADLRNAIRGEFRWVMVDEYQDVSRATALFLQQICGSENPPWVVGDARQAIYRFRGAEPENVVQFPNDFPGAQEFHLSENYRSTSQVISLLNSLAAWLDQPDHTGPVQVRWRPGKEIPAINTPAVTIGVAPSDAAERTGIISTVREWLTLGIQPEHIAVLARRNIDVRNLAIDLKRNRIRAVTSGLLTAEGAGGDLAGLLTAVDHRAGLPRLVYALGRNRFLPAELNEFAKQLLTLGEDLDNEPQWTGPAIACTFLSEIWQYLRKLGERIHSADGWVTLCDFLFFETSYLRELLSNSSDAVSAVQLEEVLSSLSLAANYRFGHPHVRPRRARLGLAERMRELATESAPGLVPPRRLPGAVRVMTCHASKGLEFPCAAVAGQSLSEVRPPAPSLPPSLRPVIDTDLAQAESLLFVGVSRAQRSAVISYAESASGTPRSKRRRFPRLLTRLQESGLLPVVLWTGGASGSTDVTIGRVWGGAAPQHVSLYSLSSNTCQVKTYLEDQLGARFRGRNVPLYPEFIARIRKMLRRVVSQTLSGRTALSDVEISQIFEEEWPEDKYSDHPHTPLYRPRARMWAKCLADIFGNRHLGESRLREEVLEWKDPAGEARLVKLQLVGHFDDANGDHVAIALQVNSPGDTKQTVNWSALKDYERLPFVLLQEQDGDLQPMIFVGDEGSFRTLQWHKQKPAQAIKNEAAAARATFVSIQTGMFQTAPNDWMCDHCSCRLVCPLWLGAAE